MKSFKLLPLAAASLALGLGTAGTAQAGSYAVSEQDIQNGTILFTVADIPNVIQGGIVTNSADQATLNGASDSDGDPINALAVNAPGGDGTTRLDNVFNIFGPGGTFANADAQIVSQQVGSGAVGDPVISTFRARNIAEYSLDGNGTADADGNNSSTTGFTTIVNVGASATFTIAFDNDPFMRALLHADSLLGSGATAEISASFTITDATGVVATWTPDGAAGGITFDGVAVTAAAEVIDEADLNRSLPTVFAGTDLSYDPIADGTCAGGAPLTAFQVAGLCNYAATFTLAAPGQYTFNLAMEERVFGAKVVPEPGTVALMGLGLLGLGFAKRRQKRA